MWTWMTGGEWLLPGLCEKGRGFLALAVRILLRLLSSWKSFSTSSWLTELDAISFCKPSNVVIFREDSFWKKN